MTPKLIYCPDFNFTVDVDSPTSWPNMADFAIDGESEPFTGYYAPTVNSYRAYINAPAVWLNHPHPETDRFEIWFKRQPDDPLKVDVEMTCVGSYLRHSHFYPLDHRMTAEDYENIEFYEVNTEGTAWLFKRSTPAAYRDLELELLAMVQAVCYPYILQAEADIAKGTPGAVDKYATLSEFYGDARDNCVEIHRNRRIGWYEHKPYEGRKHLTVLSAVNATIFKWKSEKESAAKLETISANISYILNDLAIPDGKFPWDIVDDDEE